MRRLPGTERTASMKVIAADEGYHSVSVWLNGENVSHRCLRAYVSVTPGKKNVHGWIELCDLDEDGQPFVQDGDIARHIEYGQVLWSWDETP